MRIRSVKPAFWSDPVIAQVSYQARLFYIGLWNIADDAGWLEWRPVEIGALLFPYEAPKPREKHIAAWATELLGTGRLLLHDCGCAVIPTLPKHQRISGVPSYATQKRHADTHPPLSTKQRPLSTSPGEGSSGEGEGVGQEGVRGNHADGSKNSENDAAIARNLAILNDPTASEDRKAAARFDLDRRRTAA